MNVNVSTHARIIAELRERLKAEYGLEDGDEALETTLEGASDLPEMLARMARDAFEAEAHAEAVGQIQKANAARAARLESRAQNLRVQIAWAMAESGMQRIPADALPDMTVTMRAGKPPLIIDDEARVPFTYIRVKTVESIDRAGVRAALEAGERFDWAKLGNPAPVLIIRTK